MRRLGVLALAFCLAWGCCFALAEGEVPSAYQGVALVNMTVRKEPSGKAAKQESVKAGELLEILSLDGDWILIQKSDVQGYVTAKNVAGIHHAGDDRSLAVEPEDGFIPLYTGVAKLNLSLRKEPSRDSRQLGTAYENATILLGEIGEEWTTAWIDKQVGYLLTEHLTGLKVINPHWARLPGAVYYPYAARVLSPVDLIEAGTGQVLQTLPKGAVVNARLAGEPQMLEVPYKRTWALLPLDRVELMEIYEADLAEPGELIGAFATYFPNDPQNEIDVGRLYNINKGVQLLNGLRLGPGKRFSFNAIAAPYTKANGYMRGPIINYVSDEKTGYGGGICQVSTTLYNLLLQLPMRIITTRPHSSLGIDYAPVDYDAAVGKGNLDLVFENMLPYEVELRLSSWDGVITVLMYRAKVG